MSFPLTRDLFAIFSIKISSTSFHSFLRYRTTVKCQLGREHFAPTYRYHTLFARLSSLSEQEIPPDKNWNCYKSSVIQSLTALESRRKRVENAQREKQFFSLNFLFSYKKRFAILCVSFSCANSPFCGLFNDERKKEVFLNISLLFFNIFSKREEDGWRKKSNACFHYPYLFRNEPSEYKNEIFVPTFLYFFFFSPLPTHHSHRESAAEAYTKISQLIHAVARHVATRSWVYEDRRTLCLWESNQTDGFCTTVGNFMMLETPQASTQRCKWVWVIVSMGIFRTLFCCSLDCVFWLRNTAARIRSKRATTTSCSIAISTRQTRCHRMASVKREIIWKVKQKQFFSSSRFRFHFRRDVDACAILSQLSRSSCCGCVLNGTQVSADVASLGN